MRKKIRFFFLLMLREKKRKAITYQQVNEINCVEVTNSADFTELL